MIHHHIYNKDREISKRFLIEIFKMISLRALWLAKGARIWFVKKKLFENLPKPIAQPATAKTNSWEWVHLSRFVLPFSDCDESVDDSLDDESFDELSDDTSDINLSAIEFWDVKNVAIVELLSVIGISFGFFISVTFFCRLFFVNFVLSTFFVDFFRSAFFDFFSLDFFSKLFLI